MLFIRKFNYNKLFNKRSFSCRYNEPVLFGPMFSPLFFGGVYTFVISNILLEINRNIRVIYDKQMEDRKEIDKIKEKVSKL